jgi:60 kDa SS-A/Ro ribonucleoprotein
VGAGLCYGPEHKLAQLAATGTLQTISIRPRKRSLRSAGGRPRPVDPLFVAKASVYARSRGTMKDMPALLAAYLTSPSRTSQSGSSIG